MDESKQSHTFHDLSAHAFSLDFDANVTLADVKEYIRTCDLVFYPLLPKAHQQRH